MKSLNAWRRIEFQSNFDQLTGKSRLIFKLNVTRSSLKVFIAKVKATCQIEQKIAATGNTLVKHYKKWNKFLTCFS